MFNKLVSVTMFTIATSVLIFTCVSAVAVLIALWRVS